MSAVPVDPLKAAETRKGCLAMYGIWAVFTLLFAGFLLVTGGKAGEAAFFGIVLLALPGAIWLAKQRDERLVAAAAARLGFRVREVSWRDAERVEPRFERELVRSEWHFVLVEGWRDGADVALYSYASPGDRSKRETPDSALGVIWTLPDAEFPRLVVHGPTRLQVLVPVGDGAGVSVSPPVGVASPAPGFLARFSCYGESGAEILLTEAVQRSLLALPPRSRLLAEGPRIRWELEAGPFGRSLGRRAEELLLRTMPLRDALREALRLVPRRP